MKQRNLLDKQEAGLWQKDPFGLDDPPSLRLGSGLDITTILEWTSDAVIAVDHTARIVFWNAAAEALFGYTADEIVGKPLFVIIPDARRDEAEQVLETVAHGKTPPKFETVRRHAAGHLVEVEIALSPLFDARGELAGCASITRPLSGSRRRERDLQEFVESAPIGMHWADGDGKIIWANQTHLDTLGYARSEYVGHDVREFHADPAAADAILAALRAGRTIHGAEVRMRHKDGSERHIVIDSNGAFRGNDFVHTRCFLRDVTDKVRAAADHARLAAIVEASEDAIVLRDLDGTIKTWNKGAEAMFGYTASQAVGSHISRMLTPETDALRQGWQEAIQNGAKLGCVEAQGRHRDGRTLDVSTRLFPVPDLDGGTAGIATITRDISAQKAQFRELEEYRSRLEGLVEERTRRLREAIDILTRTNEDLREFADVAAHDLREPMRKVIQFGQLLRDEIQELGRPDALHHLDRVTAAAARMGILLDDLKLYAEAGGKPLERDDVDMDALVRSVLRDLEARIDETDARIEIGSLPFVDGDARQIRHVIQNLLANALKFRRDGVAPRIRVHGTVEADGTQVIHVEDNGVGFDDAQAERLFRPFSRLHTGHDGSGMGLAIVRRIVERHGGTVKGSGSPGVGATFQVRLPARATER